MVISRSIALLILLLSTLGFGLDIYLLFHFGQVMNSLIVGGIIITGVAKSVGLIYFFIAAVVNGMTKTNSTNKSPEKERKKRSIEKFDDEV